MNRLVARGADREADHALGYRVALNQFDASLRRVERKIEEPLEPRILRQDALDHPAIERICERHFDIVLRMHAEQQHRAWEDDLIVDAERVHAAPRRDDETMCITCFDRLASSFNAKAPA